MRARARRSLNLGKSAEEIVEMIRTMREERTNAILEAANRGSGSFDDLRGTGDITRAQTSGPLSQLGDEPTPQIGAFEAKTQFSNLLDRVRHGEQIVITHRGQPVARLVPFSTAPEAQAVDKALETIQDLSRKYATRGITIDDIKSWTNAGRP
jgi:prevent-host-death family protein